MLRKIHPNRKRARNFEAECNWILASFQADHTAGVIAELSFNASLYYIWFERNQRQFQNVSRPKEKIIYDITFEVGSKARSLKKADGDSRLLQHIIDGWGLDMTIVESDQLNFSWPLPPSSFWVLSCDGSLKTNRAGYGGLIRDNNGMALIGYAGTSTTMHVLWLELFAVCGGLEIANLMIHMDSKLGIDIVRGAAHGVSLA